jgi:hypothetical protein
VESNLKNLMHQLKVGLFTYHDIPMWINTNFCEGDWAPARNLPTLKSTSSFTLTNLNSLAGVAFPAAPAP